jgi:hypothetical protein
VNLQQRISALANDLGIEPGTEAASRQLSDLAAGCGLKLVCIDVPKHAKTTLDSVYVLNVNGDCIYYAAEDDDSRFAGQTIAEMSQRHNGDVVLKLNDDSQVVVPKHRIVALRYVPAEV